VKLLDITVKILDVTKFIALTKGIYMRSAVGCCLHILLDDGNVHDSDAAFCLEVAKKAGHQDCIEVATALVNASPTQRRKLRYYR
jgi:hypothetical protein